MIEMDMSEVAKLAPIFAAAPAQAIRASALAGSAVAREIKARAQAAAPRGETGWLATDGIRMSSGRDTVSTHAEVFTVTNEHGRNEGFYVEYGTSHMAPQPFLVPQMAWAAPAFFATVTAAVDPLGHP